MSNLVALLVVILVVQAVFVSAHTYYRWPFWVFVVEIVIVCCFAVYFGTIIGHQMGMR